MSDTNLIPTQEPADKATLYDGLPYLVTRVVNSLHHILLLPRSWDIEHLIAFAEKQVRANKLPTRLTLGENLCIYFLEDGTACQSSNVPRSASITSGKLAPAEPIPDSAELAIRRMKLILMEEAQCKEENVYILGDLTKGGHLPTPDEEEHLAGTHAGNVPKGFWPCPRCGEWRGECFDTLLRELIVRVHCMCENDNLCAACGGRLHLRKLNANHFDPADGKIWHTPAFSGFHHRCSTTCVSTKSR
jgi:hypothetical protein